MGKNVHDEQQQQQQEEGGGAGDRLSLGNHGPSCMWGILHHFQHNRWLNAKKLKLTSSKHHHHHHHHHPDQGSTKTGSDDSTAVVETKAKNSMKSRLKSLITDEILSKKKGGGSGGGRHHQRSTSYPNRAPPDDDHHATPDPTPDTTTTPPCEMCTTMLDLNYNNNDDHNNIAPPPRQVPSVRDHHRDSIQESKLFMNALDLLNLRKEVFMKILHDPNSSLAHQLHHHRSNNNNTNALNFSKSVSFPASSSSSSPIPDSENKTDPPPPPQANDPEMELELTDINDKRHTDHHHQSNNSKTVVLKGFKNLREKIKHVIRDRKKEKNRIMMDAVHHKIPLGGAQNNNNLNNTNNNKFGKKQRGHHNRTSSFDESYTRYARLLDTITPDTPANAYAKHPATTTTATTTTTSSPKPPVFKRILSLPDMRAYSSIHDDDNDNIRVLDPARASHDNLFDVGSTFDDSVDSKTWETASSNDLNNPPPPQTDYDHDDDDEIGGEDSSELIPMDMASDRRQDDLAIEKLYKELLQLHAGTEKEAEFNYVKDVLEMSGFTRDELLGEWHSAERPVDPSVYDEVEGDHLLLFDLINEVLLELHDRSFCYWPVPLTVRSRIQQMPRGYRVLEEVWAEINWLMSWTPDIDRTIDDVVSRDLAKHDRWMSLQMDAEFVGIEVEDLIFDDLLDEIIVSI